MDASIAAVSHAPTRRGTVRGAVTQTLPLHAPAAVRVSAPSWLWILGGAVAGAALFGPVGAVAGAAAGYLLLR